MLRASLVATTILALGVEPTYTARASTLTTIYSISGTGDGYASDAPLIKVSGRLYGVTSGGGTHGGGIVFKVNPLSGDEEVLHSFGAPETSGDAVSPSGGLVEAGGTLYGTASGGGTDGDGAVYQINPTTGAESVLYSFRGAAHGLGPLGGLINVGGLLYGTTEYGGANKDGIVYSIDPTSGAETVIHPFASASDGQQPRAGLIDVGGTLYGTTSAGGPFGEGTVYAIDLASGAFRAVCSLSAKIGAATAGLVSNGSDLFTTVTGGRSAPQGGVVKVNPATGACKLLYAFSTAGGYGPQSAPISMHGMLYGTTSAGGPGGNGTIYALDPKTGSEALVYSFTGGTDGGAPVAPLFDGSGTLYGTTVRGPGNSGGTVFKLNPATGAESVLHTFTGTAVTSGAAGLGEARGAPYATIFPGGKYGAGQMVRISPTTHSVKTLYAFQLAGDAYAPAAPLAYVNGSLYGASYSGGTTNQGTLFAVNPLTGAESVVHSFGSAGDGIEPNEYLTNVGGTLWGLTYRGGSGNEGTLFKFDPVAGTETPVLSYVNSDPVGVGYSGVTLVGTRFYATSPFSSGNGAVYEVNPTTGKITVVYRFANSPDGSFPVAGLIKVNGKLYGTTSYGGASNNGVVYELDPATKAESVLYSFANTPDGADPGTLTYVGGMLYGTTFGGGANGHGTLFQIDPTSAAETVLYSFTGGTDGGSPVALINVKGTFYGATSTGGAANFGTLFTFTP
jgi:uncharacterized repeat protein (TIGR03803 family)